MVELGLPINKDFQKRSLLTVYKYFSPYWGKYEENGFQKIPNSIGDLKLLLTRKNKFLGGFYELDLSKRWTLNDNVNWSIVLSHKFWQTTKFVTKSKDSLATNITESLNHQDKLIKKLSRLDLLEVKISAVGKNLDLKVTPMGGGICYLMIPPVRYNVPLPENQIKELTWCMEMLGSSIVKHLS